MFSNKDKPSVSCEGTSCMWLVFTVIFFATTLTLTATILFLILNNPQLQWKINDGDGDRIVVGGSETVSGGNSSGGGTRHTSKVSNVFAELTQEEIQNILTFLKEDKALDITSSENATTTDNYVYMMEIKQPGKSEMLEYLDAGAEKPSRDATVVLVMGSYLPQKVLEIAVSPLPNAESWWQTAEYNWNLRPRLSPPEFKAMDAFLKTKTIPAKNALQRVFGFGFPDCITECLEWTFTTPSVPVTNRRNTWITFRRPLSGSALHALPLYFLIDDQHRDSENWRILQIIYKRSTFTSIEAFRLSLESTTSLANVTQQGKARTSLKKEAMSQSSPPETKGKVRHQLDGERVRYFNWTFDFRHHTSTGIQLFDIRFNDKRIIYELSVQGIMSFYTGDNPFMMHARYLENLEPLGHSTSQLVPGIDCPNNADFFDGYYYDAETGSPKLREKYICVFEHNTDVPLKRYRSATTGEYGGIVGRSLVVRTIQTFIDTDFIFDFNFYNNGALETRFYTSGYPLGTYWSEEYDGEELFGYPISDEQLSPVSTHLVNYKIDLDIQGTSNRHAVDKIELYSGQNPYFPHDEIAQRRITNQVKLTEKASKLTHDLSKPKIILFYNQASKNRFGKPRAYRIQLDGVAQNLEVPGWTWENGVSWARHQMVVSRHKDKEQSSSLMYDAMDPYEPPGNFPSFIENDEKIVDKDLVAWVTVGNHRLPSTSDVPLASTLDTNGGFKLVPFNYFDEDPSTSHPDWTFQE